MPLQLTKHSPTLPFFLFWWNSRTKFQNASKLEVKLLLPCTAVNKHWLAHLRSFPHFSAQSLALSHPSDPHHMIKKLPKSFSPLIFKLHVLTPEDRTSTCLHPIGARFGHRGRLRLNAPRYHQHPAHPSSALSGWRVLKDSSPAGIWGCLRAADFGLCKSRFVRF